MSVNKRTIIFTAIFVSIFALSTALICLLECFYGEYPFYDFLLTILGGCFASMIVVMACEIQKYSLNKCQIESYMFNNMTIAYSKILIMKNSMDEVINHPEKPVLKNSLTQCREQALFALSNVCNCDYTTFCKKRGLARDFYNFCNKAYQIDRKINNIRYFDMAIGKDEIKELEKIGHLSTGIDGNSATVAIVAKLLARQLQSVINDVEDFMSKIDYNNKFKWNERKLSEQDRVGVFSQDHSLENFIKENKES